MQTTQHLASTFGLVGALLLLAAIACAWSVRPWTEDGLELGTINIKKLVDGSFQWKYVDHLGVQRVEVRSGMGEDAQLLASTEFTWEGRRVVRREFRDRGGAPAQRNGIAQTEYAYEPDVLRCQFQTVADSGAHPTSSIGEIVVRHRDDDVMRIEYVDPHGAPTLSSRGFAGQTLHYEDNRIVEMQFVGVDGGRVEGSYCDVPTYVVRYDYIKGIGRLVVEHCLDERGTTLKSSVFTDTPLPKALCECGAQPSGQALADLDCKGNLGTTSTR